MGRFCEGVGWYNLYDNMLSRAVSLPCCLQNDSIAVVTDGVYTPPIDRHELTARQASYAIEVAVVTGQVA